ncbi:hypothetical protein ES705_01954 [subsurface metagenome]
MRFALVDHDTNYFTKPEQLENVYEKIWDKIPICLSNLKKVGETARMKISDNFFISRIISFYIQEVYFGT